YMEYIGRDEGIMRIYQTEEAVMPERGILVTEGTEVNELTVPEGIRLGYALNREYAEEFFRREGIGGYALANNEIIFFENGRTTNSIKFQEDHPSITMTVTSGNLDEVESEYATIYKGEGGSDTQIEYDIEGWEIVDTDQEI
ncbi:MAG: hypothetical protein SXQ77_12640, partial [Halobacteria archaeon]|nr:hypothetical protein [Halobacteria archaeon]